MRTHVPINEKILTQDDHNDAGKTLFALIPHRTLSSETANFCNATCRQYTN